MKIRALIVDDEEQIIRTVGDIVKSLNHTFDSAGDLETATRLLESKNYDYLILDMNIPVGPGRLTGRRENGRNFIGTIRSNARFAKVPIIVVTGQDKGESDFIISVLQAGGMDLTQYIQKPVDGDKLDTAIHKALAQKGTPQRLSPLEVKLEPFSSAQREMIIYEDRITLLGAEVWRECEHTQTRDALALLSKKDGNGFIRIRGTKLTKDVGRQATNQIGKPLADLCNRISEVLLEKGISCGREDVILNKAGGYHFREWMAVRVVGDWATVLGVTPVKAEELATHERQLNERQKWVIAQIEQGTRLTLKDVVAHFRSDCNRSTINRDLKELRERNLIKTGTDGAYTRV